MDNINIALYGEYYVAAMLYKRGWTANLTLKNYPGIDIFGFNPSKNIHSCIQVKTGCNKYTVLLGPTKNKFNINNIKGPYVFVHVGKNDSPDCFILAQNDVISLINNKLPLTTNGSPIKFKWNELVSYKDQWDNLWK